MRQLRDTGLVAAVLLLTATAGFAQATWQPTPAPARTAESEEWYRSGEPIPWGDELYYQAGAAVFFNRYQMVRSGSYRGIPLYTDSTQDASGIVYVPAGGGLMQPYERRRTGGLAGTTGNRAPSFPVGIAAEGIVERPTEPSPSPFDGGRTQIVEPVPTTGRSIVEAPRPAPGSVLRPKGINGVWITYDGHQWFATGKAVRLGSDFKEAGQYKGFPVYRREHDDGQIYLPTAQGMVAPYSLRDGTGDRR